LKSALFALGVLVLVATGVDVVWTVLAAGSGGGPLTARLSRVAWRVALRLGRRPGPPRHALLAVFGLAIVVGMLLSWVVVVYGAWWLVTSAAEGAVRVAETGQPADLIERASFVGQNLFTLGTSTHVAGDGLWQLLPVAIVANGLIFLTLGISYLVPVAAAVAERRQLAQYIHSLGMTPDLVLTEAWTGRGFGSLAQHLVSLTPMVHLAGERQLTYPVLAYFHSVREHASSTVALVVLDEALTLLEHGVDAEVRPDRASIAALRRAVASCMDTMAGSVVDRDLDPLPAPDLVPLREAGIPTVSDSCFSEAMANETDRRRLLTELLRHDGWSGDEWERRRQRLTEKE
jgi:hypothetical protein